MKSTPTHAMIAAACGVNVSTVSRALNDNPVIPEPTRRKIRAKAEEMGWKVNPLVSVYMAHLRSSRKVRYRANIAYVIPFPHVQKLDQLPGYHLEQYQGCQQQAQGLGYGLEPIWYAEWEGSGKRLSALLRSRGIPGVILYGISVTDDIYHDFDWAGFSVAAWGGATSRDFQLHHSSPHLHYDMSLALCKIREYGYRKIALMLFEMQDELSSHAFYASYLYEKTFDQAGLSYQYLKLSERDSVQARKKLAREWLGKHEIDLVIGEQIVWELLDEMNLKVPQDIGFVSMCWSSGWPHIGGVDQQAGIIGRNTVDLVVDQLVRNERGMPENPKLLYNGGLWMDGPSCPPRE
jgi:DNA-binding LacI/PurR family transcriptional regulator